MFETMYISGRPVIVTVFKARSTRGIPLALIHVACN